MNEIQRGKIIVISGFSGAGKGTVMNRLMEKYGDNYALSVSATTRAPRSGEIEGVSYFYKTDEEFQKMIENDELIEYAGYVGHYYGTPRSYVEKNLSAGKDVLLEIEIQGAMNIKSKYPDAVLLFITAPSAEVLKNRLLNRGSETREVVRERLLRATKEAEGVDSYDYIVVNDDLEKCVEEVDRIIKSAHNIAGDRLSLIDGIKNDLNNLLKENC